VKVKMSNYALKRPKHRQTCVDFKQTIRIGALPVRSGALFLGVN